MPRVAMGFDLTVTPRAAAQTGEASWLIGVNTAATDSAEFDLTVTRTLAKAWEAGQRFIGWTLEADLDGSGTLTTVDAANLGPTITINESQDGWADTVSFTLEGKAYSPFLVDAIRGKRQVRVTGYLGIAGEVQSRVVFEGYFDTASFGAWPASASISCLDEAGLHARKEVYLDVPPGSLRTRLDIATTVLTDNSVPIGVLELGPDDGGRVVKPVSVSGVPIFDFLRDFLSPCGVSIGFEGGKFYARARVRPASTPDRTLTAQHIAPDLNVSTPATNNANVIVTTGVVYEWLDDLGYRTVVSDTRTTGSYAPKGAVLAQDHTTGNQTVVDYSGAEATRTLTRDRSTKTFLDGSLINTENRHWSWFSAEAAPFYQASGADTYTNIIPDPVLTYNPDVDVYQYADGTWHIDPVETFQETQASTHAYTYTTGSGYLSTDTLNVRSFVWRPQAVASIDNAITGAMTRYATYVTADRSGAESYAQSFDWNSQIVWRYYPDEDARVIYHAGEFYDHWFSYTNKGTYPVYVLYDRGGSVANSDYKVNAGASPNPTMFRWGYSTWTREIIDDVRYRETVTTVTRAQPTPISAAAEYNGSVPRVWQQAAKQDPQLARVTRTDAVQVGLNGTHTYYVHNEYCETIGELVVVAEEALREQGAWEVSFSMPPDLVTHKGRTLRLSIPGLSNSDVDVLVNSTTTTINGRTGECSQSVNAKYYPPELS